MWLAVPLSVWLAVVAQAQLYIFRCVDVSQLPQFKSVASDTVSESSQVPVKVFKLMVRVADWAFLILNISIFGPLTLSFFFFIQSFPSS